MKRGMIKQHLFSSAELISLQESFSPKFFRAKCFKQRKIHRQNLSLEANRIFREIQAAKFHLILASFFG